MNPGKYDCIFVPVYVRPQSMVEEQACFGVVAHCPEAGFFACRLARDDDAVIDRIVRFFPKYGRANLEQAMTWAAQDVEYTIRAERERGDKGAFANLIRPRENVVRYGPTQVIMTDDPAAELEKLYHRAVGI